MNRIKIIVASAIFSALLFLVGCETDYLKDKDFYPRYVYIVGAESKIIDRDLNIGPEKDTISIAIAVSGTQELDKDVYVKIAEVDGAIEAYNDKELSSEVTHYQKLNSDIYSFISDEIVVRKGEVYNTYPIVINPETLHCDSLYMLAFIIESISDFNLGEEDTLALVRINLINDFSGLYYMDGVIKNTELEDDSTIYKMPRNAQALEDGQTVRFYHYNNEFTNGDANDYRPTHTFKITVNEDNSLSFETFDQFELVNGGGTWNERWKLYDLWYEYKSNNIIYRVEGFMYKERKTDEEQRLLEDYIDEQRGII